MPRRSHAFRTPRCTAAAHAARLPRAHAYRRSLSADGPPPAVASPAAKDRQFREGAETRPFQVRIVAIQCTSAVIFGRCHSNARLPEAWARGDTCAVAQPRQPAGALNHTCTAFYRADTQSWWLAAACCACSSVFPVVPLGWGLGWPSHGRPPICATPIACSHAGGGVAHDGHHHPQPLLQQGVHAVAN